MTDPRPMRPFEGACRSCKAKIFMFPYTDREGRARWMPVDPDDAGDQPDGDEWDHTTMTSHFFTCPDAEQWRKKNQE